MELTIDPAVSASRWPDRVEAAAYFCCTHAIADAGATSVTLRVTPGTAKLEITLGGGRLDDSARQSMLDRVDALRGDLEDTGAGIVIRLPREVEPSVAAG